MRLITISGSAVINSDLNPRNAMKLMMLLVALISLLSAEAFLVAPRVAVHRSTAHSAASPTMMPKFIKYGAVTTAAAVLFFYTVQVTHAHTHTTRTHTHAHEIHRIHMLTQHAAVAATSACAPNPRLHPALTPD